jgi:hypothetical protein
MRASPRSSSNIPSTFSQSSTFAFVAVTGPTRGGGTRLRGTLCTQLRAGACSSDWLSLVSNSHACSTSVSPDWYSWSRSA